MNKGTVAHMHGGFVFGSKVTSSLLQKGEDEGIKIQTFPS